MTFESREDTSLILRLRDARLRLKEARVEVGLPASAPARSRWLLALHERGAPAAGIPPRPVIGPALADPEVRRAMAGALEEACEAAGQGDAEGVEAGLSRCGQAGVDGIRAYIDRGISPGNAPSVIARKGFDKPLVETGALYDSFGYEVK